jgi:hypothetical protein
MSFFLSFLTGIYVFLSFFLDRYMYFFLSFFLDLYISFFRSFFLTGMYFFRSRSLFGPSKPTFLRVLRVFRVLRLVKVNKEIKKTIGTLMVCLPQLSNVLAVLGLLVIVFAILGKELFWRVKFQDNINEYSNFRYFWPAFMLLMRAMTGESYNALMHDCRVQLPYCSYHSLCYHDVFGYVACDGFYVNPDDPDLGFGLEDDQMSYVVCNNKGCSVANATDQKVRIVSFWTGIISFFLS